MRGEEKGVAGHEARLAENCSEMMDGAVGGDCTWGPGAQAATVGPLRPSLVSGPLSGEELPG